LGERLAGSEKVASSILVISTIFLIKVINFKLFGVTKKLR